MVQLTPRQTLRLQPRQALRSQLSAWTRASLPRPNARRQRWHIYGMWQMTIQWVCLYTEQTHPLPTLHACCFSGHALRQRQQSQQSQSLHQLGVGDVDLLAGLEQEQVRALVSLVLDKRHGVGGVGVGVGEAMVGTLAVQREEVTAPVIVTMTTPWALALTVAMTVHRQGSQQQSQQCNRYHPTTDEVVRRKRMLLVELIAVPVLLLVLVMVLAPVAAVVQVPVHRQSIPQ